MGLGMAINLQRHLAANGLAAPLHYSNRTLSRGESLREIGAIPEDDFEKVLGFASVVFTMASHPVSHSGVNHWLIMYYFVDLKRCSTG